MWRLYKIAGYAKHLDIKVYKNNCNKNGTSTFTKMFIQHL